MGKVEIYVGKNVNMGRDAKIIGDEIKLVVGENLNNEGQIRNPSKFAEAVVEFIKTTGDVAKIGAKVLDLIKDGI